MYLVVKLTNRLSVNDPAENTRETANRDSVINQPIPLDKLVRLEQKRAAFCQWRDCLFLPHRFGITVGQTEHGDTLESGASASED